MTGHASLHLILSRPSIAGTLTLTVPAGWHVDSIGAPAGVPCAGVGTTVGSCSLVAWPAGSFAFTVVASGPSSDTPPAVHVDYVDVGARASADFLLVGP